MWHYRIISVLGKRVLTYWEITGYMDYSQMSGPVVPMENYTFLERGRLSSFQKYIVLYAYYSAIHLAVIKLCPIFVKFPSTLVPFSQIRNQICRVFSKRM